jgi:hypothetical protein
MSLREIFDRRRAWLAVGIGVAALLAGGLYVALGDGSDGSSDGADKAAQVEVPAATDGDETGPGGGGGDDSSPSGKGAGGDERRHAPAERGSTSEETPKDGASSGSAKLPDAEKAPPTEQSSVSEPNRSETDQPRVRYPNRPYPDQPRVRYPNRPYPDQPPVRYPNRYGGQPSEESGGRGG